MLTLGVVTLCTGLASEATAQRSKGSRALFPSEESSPPKPDPAKQAPPEATPLHEMGEKLDEGQEASASHSGSYGGVAPGEKVKPPRAPRKKNPVRVTWTGFQVLPDGISRVFVEMTSEAPYQVTETAQGLQIALRGARLHLRNHGRPLDTRFFNSPVARVKVGERRGAVTVEIETKGKPAHTERFEAQGGYQFLMVEFPSQGGAGEQATTSTK